MQGGLALRFDALRDAVGEGNGPARGVSFFMFSALMRFATRESVEDLSICRSELVSPGKRAKANP